MKMPDRQGWRECPKAQDRPSEEGSCSSKQAGPIELSFCNKFWEEILKTFDLPKNMVQEHISPALGVASQQPCISPESQGTRASAAVLGGRPGREGG